MRNAGFLDRKSCIRGPNSGFTPGPKVRARCGSAARRDLCGGPRLTGVPTATTVGVLQHADDTCCGQPTTDTAARAFLVCVLNSLEHYRQAAISCTRHPEAPGARSEPPTPNPADPSRAPLLGTTRKYLAAPSDNSTWLVDPCV